MASRYNNPFSDIGKIARDMSKISPIFKSASHDICKLINFRKEMKKDNEYRKSIYKNWNELEKTLQTRFKLFKPKSKLLSDFELFASKTKYLLPEKTLLYRARKIKGYEFPINTENAIEIISDTMNNRNEESYNEYEKYNLIDNISYIDWENYFAYIENLKNKIFWGFDKENSDAPKRNKSQGRANSSGLSYLYTADNIDTAISEIQPSIEQFVSVAEIKTKKELNIYNFDYPDNFNDTNYMDKDIIEIEKDFNISKFWHIRIFFNTISELFSRPNMGNIKHYRATQYISEHIKKMGFDGIKYRSSLTKEGSNIVLFNTSKGKDKEPLNYEILNSNIFRVKNITVSSKAYLPIMLDNKKDNIND